jgi:GNAT superfamily N-acetyltransferase
MRIKVTRAAEADIPELVSILTQGVTYKLRHDDHSWGSGVFTEHEVMTQLAKGDTYAARIGNEIVATFELAWEDERMWGPQPPDAGYIHRLAVKDGWHGHDLGGQIIEWSAREIKRRGRQFLRLDSDERNTKLCAYYERNGFKQVGQKLIPDQKDYLANLYERRA